MQTQLKCVSFDKPQGHLDSTVSIGEQTTAVQ